MSADADVPTESDPSGGSVPRAGTDDFRLLLTVIAGIALGVAAAAMPTLISVRSPAGRTPRGSSCG